MKVVIIYSQLLDPTGKEQCIGGVETYLLNLAKVCSELGYEPVLFQRAFHYFEKKIGDLKIIGVPVAHRNFKKIKYKLYNAAINCIDASRDILIFGGDHHSVPTDYKRSIIIQHGINWDLPLKYLTSQKLFHYRILSTLYRIRLSLIYKNIINWCPYIVCVDYNYLNWYRTLSNHIENKKFWVIPNCALKIAALEQFNMRNYDNNKIKIIFARRLTEYRGTRLMEGAIKNILQSHENVYFTFAGNGPDEVYLKNQFSNEKRISFIKYYSQDALNIHLEHDVAVIPSLGSEGTSFSVVEAMAAGCAIIATCVGGITNMIIDNYNGILVMPTIQSLTMGIKKVISDRSLRKKISINAYNTARNSFNFEIWKQRWREVFKEVSDAK